MKHFNLKNFLYLLNYFVIFYFIVNVSNIFGSDLSHSSYIIRNTLILDVTGKKKIYNADIEVSNGFIKKIENKILKKSINEYDAMGAIVLPGLIDSHVHLKSIPGSYFRNDDEDTYWELFDHHLRAYLAAGVTTVLDAASPADLVERIQHYNKIKKTMPDIMFLSPFLTPENGYFSTKEMRSSIYSNLSKGIRGYNDIDTAIADAKKNNSSGIKLTLEEGFGPFKVWKIFDKDMRDYIARQSLSSHLPLFIHSMKKDMHIIALSLKPRALMHSGFSDEQITDSIIYEMKKSGVFVISTLSIEDSMLLKWDKTRLANDVVLELTPKIELDTVNNYKAWDLAFKTTIDISTPKWIPRFLARIFSSFFINESIIKKRLSSSQIAVQKMYQAGVPIVKGTDSGCWPILPQLFHGPTSLRELELLVSSGLTPISAIQAATINAAKMLKIDDKIGTVEAGKKADLIIVEGNPLLDIKNLKNLKWVIKDGIVYNPRDLIVKKNLY